MRLIFAGTPAIAAHALEAIAQKHEIALVITREDAPVGRKRVLTPSPVALRAQELGVEVVKSSKVANIATQIRNANAELGVVVAFGALIPQSVLEIMPWWNLHFSLLPSWRGATPLQHSMITGQGAGISIFELEAGLDTGPIIATKAMEFGPSETAQEALVRFTQAGSNLLLSALESRPTAQPQQGEVSLAPKISRDQARLNFELGADELAARINALNPEPTAWAELAGAPVKLLRAKSLGAIDWNSFDSPRSPGELWVSEARVLLQCGKGSRVELLEIQPAGKKQMAALDFMRGQQGQVRLD